MIVNPAHREARLKPEFASLYPSIPAGQWRTVGEILDCIRAARLLGRRPSGEMLRGRLLDDQHFEFRGEPSESVRRRDRRTRVTDH
jgi:hypothetical protein